MALIKNSTTDNIKIQFETIFATLEKAYMLNKTYTTAWKVGRRVNSILVHFVGYSKTTIINAIILKL